MSSADVAGHIGFGLVALSYIVRDVLWLRILGVAACVVFMVYNHLAPATPLWPVIYWNAGFLAVNVWQLLRIARERPILAPAVAHA